MGTFTTLAVREGKYRIQVVWARDMSTPPAAITQSFDAGGRYFIRISGDAARVSAMGSEVAVVSIGDAEAELATCCRYVPPLVDTIR